MTAKGITCNNAIEAEAFRFALQDAGIKSITYDETNSKVARGILDNTMEVMVNEADHEQALQVYQAFTSSRQKTLPWCPKCGSEDVNVEEKKHSTARALPRIIATFLMMIPFGKTKTHKFVCNSCGYRWERCLMLLILCLMSVTGHLYAQETWEPIPQESQVDICIYGATSAGITAAIEARRQGHSVMLIEPGSRIGGLTAGGLGFTDIGKVEIIQGIALSFYRRVGQVYGSAEPAFHFEPKVALQVYRQMLNEAGIEVYMQRRIRSVKKHGNKLQSILLERASAKVSQKRVRVSAKVFIDCSYEGDLMARAGVTYTIGRESDQTYNEEFNGLHMRQYHQFPDGVDPYKEKGNPRSGLLWGILPGEMGTKGQADKRVQAYNFRLTMTDDPANRLPITRPERYDSTRYELLLRWKEVEPWKNGINDCFAWSLMPNHKTDVNNRGAFSTDMIGENWDYPEASYSQRKRIFQRHVDYTLGLLYFVSHDPRIPESVRREIGEWGWPRDEYEENNHFTPQMYIRESRRMVGRYIMTQANCQRKATVEDVIGWAAYTMDSHNTGRYVVGGMVKNEGDVEIPIPGKYDVSYRSLTPQESEARNLLVPVCLSASHIAYGSIRMEPVFMVLGQTSALAACQAIDRHNCCVQQVSAQRVMERFSTLDP